MATAVTTYGQTYGRYTRPSSAKLAGVKFELYHPGLPTLRRMSMDDMTHKLPFEHSRTTTPCNRGDFANAGITLRRRGWSEPNLPCQTIMSKETSAKLKSTQNIKTRNFTENWRAILSAMNDHNSPRTEQKECGTQTDPLQLLITGLAPRTQHPEVTGSWQYNRPSSAQWSRPTTPRQRPANMYTRYRSLSYRAQTANPWN